MINEERLKQQVIKAISLKPTHIVLMRNEKKSNGMRGGTSKEITVAELDVLIDDSTHSNNSGNNSITGFGREAGSVYRVKSLKMLAVVDNFKIEVGDYFIIDDLRYEVIYPGLLIGSIYNSDLEVTN